MSDRIVKLLLAAIALGLWANAVGNWIQAPLEAQQPVQLSPEVGRTIGAIADSVETIERYVGLIAEGRCSNSVICPQ